MKYRNLIGFVVLSLLATTPVKAQDSDFSIKDGFSVSANCEFKVDKSFSNILLGGSIPTLSFSVHEGDKQYSLGGTAFYTYHPIKNKGIGVERFFTRFGLGAEYNYYGSTHSNNKTFLFNAKLLLGYTFKFKKIGIEIFTGPVGKFAPYRRSENYGQDLVKMYTGGVAWTFGAGVRNKHIGLNIAYNQHVSKYFEHYNNSQFDNNPLLNSMTVGLQYYF